MEANNVTDHSHAIITSNSQSEISEKDTEFLIKALKKTTSSATQSSSTQQPLQWLQPFSIAPLSIADTDARFNQEHPPQSRGLKRRGGGRPRKPDSELKRPRVDPRAKPTKLRPTSAIGLHIPPDVWFHIFLFTDYQTVHKLRETCRETYEATDSVIFWKEYIKRHAFSDEMTSELPDLPPGLNLFQYADLLFGKGCMRCGAAKSRKVQWAFYRRWCKACFSEMTYSDPEAKSITNKYGDLLGCIPTGIIDIWRNYYSVSTSTANEITANYRSEKKYVAVTKKQLTAIVKECEHVLESLPPDMTDAERQEHLATWRAEKTTENQEFLRHAKLCEDFANERETLDKEAKSMQQREFRTEREQFFIEKAARLQPPVSHVVLQKIPGYRRSLAVKRPPTERSWREILCKIPQYRDAAERETQQESHLSPVQLYGQASRRNSLVPPDTSVVKLLEEFAEKAMRDLEKAGTAAEDFTYLTLQRVRQMYYNLPEQHQPSWNEEDYLKPEDGSNSYVLTMADALNTYSQKVEPRLRTWQQDNKIKTMPKFFCPGCTRRDYRRAWSFRKLFSHLCCSHAKRDLSSPFRSYAETPHARQTIGLFADLFHWRGIPWPHNLPILALHHKSTGRWDPDYDVYEYAPPVRNDSFLSPFEGRSVKQCETNGSTAVEIATDAIIEASRALSGIDLRNSLKGLIAWVYATANLQNFTDKKLMPNDLDDLSIALIRNKQFMIFSRVGCKFCEKRCDTQTDRYMSVRSHLKYTEVKHSFDTIVRHWKQDHYGATNRFDVATEMLLFPSERKLAEELFETAESGDELREAFNSLFPLRDSRESSPKFEAIPASLTSDSAFASELERLSRDGNKMNGNVTGNTGRRIGQGSSSSSLDQTALNLLAEQAAKIDPRLANEEALEEANGVNDDLNSEGEVAGGLPDWSSAK